MAIDVDLSPISYRANLQLNYSVQVGPGETPSLASNEVIDNKITPLVLRDPLTLNEAVVTALRAQIAP